MEQHNLKLNTNHYTVKPFKSSYPRSLFLIKLMRAMAARKERLQRLPKNVTQKWIAKIILLSAHFHCVLLEVQRSRFAFRLVRPQCACVAAYTTVNMQWKWVLGLTSSVVTWLKGFLHRKIIEHSFVPKEGGFHSMSLPIVRKKSHYAHHFRGTTHLLTVSKTHRAAFYS